MQNGPAAATRTIREFLPRSSSSRSESNDPSIIVGSVIEEARLEETEGGLAPATEGWFVVNVRDGRWVTNDVLGDAIILEGDDVSFPQNANTTTTQQPNQPH